MCITLYGAGDRQCFIIQLSVVKHIVRSNLINRNGVISMIIDMHRVIDTLGRFVTCGIVRRHADFEINIFINFAFAFVEFRRTNRDMVTEVAITQFDHFTKVGSAIDFKINLIAQLGITTHFPADHLLIRFQLIVVQEVVFGDIINVDRGISVVINVHQMIGRFGNHVTHVIIRGDAGVYFYSSVDFTEVITERRRVHANVVTQLTIAEIDDLAVEFHAINF